MAFRNTWDALQSNLPVGTVVPNWTVQKGLVGDPFKIAEVTSTAIVVDTPGAETLQRVPRHNFEEVYNRWEPYRRGAMARSTFTPLTRYSKYIISILHWLEKLRGGQLP